MLSSMRSACFVIVCVFWLPHDVVVLLPLVMVWLFLFVGFHCFVVVFVLLE